MPWNQFFVLQELDSQIDRLKEEQRLASLLSDKKTAHLDLESARARRQANEVEAKLRAREEERAEAAAPIPAAFLGFYDRIRKKWRSPPWVVGLSGASCPACNLSLPSKLVGDAQRTAEPMPCPNCARLLIWRTHSDPSLRPA